VQFRVGAEVTTSMMPNLMLLSTRVSSSVVMERSVRRSLNLPCTDLRKPLTDQDARSRAVDPLQNVVLEASAGTGKTRVLVERYVNLLRAGAEPDQILAITFTRKAAAEMRQRIIERLKEAARLSQFDAARWRDLGDRLGDIAISTIDAFCLSLLREFPGRRGSRVRPRRRNTGAAARQRIARPRAAHLSGPGARG
jgi:ATP-dependent exoDNAse (exonuclease V) beta subunit